MKEKKIILDCKNNMNNFKKPTTKSNDMIIRYAVKIMQSTKIEFYIKNSHIPTFENMIPLKNYQNKK